MLLGPVSDSQPKNYICNAYNFLTVFLCWAYKETRKPFKICVAGGPSGTGLHIIDQYFLITLKHIFFTDQFSCNALWCEISVSNKFSTGEGPEGKVVVERFWLL